MAGWTLLMMAEYVFEGLAHGWPFMRMPGVPQIKEVLKDDSVIRVVTISGQTSTIKVEETTPIAIATR